MTVYGSDFTEEEQDEIDAWFENLLSDKKLLEFLDQERKRLERGVPRNCPWGCCEILIDPLDNKIITSIGLVGCGCDNLPGWRSRYYEGLPKRGWNVKPVGRHGGKIARSRKKHREHAQYLRDMTRIEEALREGFRSGH